MFDQRAGVYCMTCTVDGSQYVGSTKNVRKRVWTHQSSLKKGIHGNSTIQELYNIYGETCFNYRVLEYTDGSSEELIKKEEYYIDILKPSLNKRRIYKKEGQARDKLIKRVYSEETSKKMSESAKARAERNGMDHATKAAAEVNTGKSRSTAVRAKISQTKLRKFETGEYQHHTSYNRNDKGQYTG